MNTAPATLDRIRRHLVDLRMPRCIEVLEHLLRQLERGEISALEAIDQLLDEELSLRERIRFLCRPQLLVVDEIGYLPVIAGGGNLFFQPVNARYERGAMILTSNRGFTEWGEVFGDTVVATALLDRLLHHAIVVRIEGASHRLRRHADLLPDSSAPRPIQQPDPAPRRRGRPPNMRNVQLTPATWPPAQLGNFQPALLRKSTSALTAAPTAPQQPSRVRSRAPEGGPFCTPIRGPVCVPIDRNGSTRKLKRAPPVRAGWAKRGFGVRPSAGSRCDDVPHPRA
jgi:hypothetical protein